MRQAVAKFAKGKAYQDMLDSAPKLRLGKANPDFAARRDAYWEKREGAERLISAVLGKE